MPTAVLSPPATYQLDLGRCVVEVAVRPLGVVRLRAVDGTLVLGDRPWGRLELADLVTEDLTVDAIAFESTDIRVTGEDTAQVVGELELGDYVGPLVLDARLIRLGEGEVAVAAEGSLSRKAWGLAWGSLVEQAGIVSDTARITIAARFQA